MFTRSLMIVCLALSGFAAQAGVIVTSSDDQDLINAEVGVDVMTAWFELQQSNDANSLYLHGQCDDLSAVSTTVVSAGGFAVSILGQFRIHELPMLVWQFSLANSVLPPTPILDSLIKPS